MEVGAGKNFAVIAKFDIQRLFGFQGPFSYPNCFIKRGLGSFSFYTLHIPLSPLPCAPPLPCTSALSPAAVVSLALPPSPEPAAKPQSPASLSAQKTAAAASLSPALHQALFCPYHSTTPHQWFIPVVAIVIGPGSSSVPLRETVLALPSLQSLTLRTRLQSHHLHWPQMLYRRSLRFLSPHPSDIRPGWDLEPD